MFPFFTDRLNDRLKTLQGFIILAQSLVAFSNFSGKVEILGVKLKHLLENFDRFLVHLILFAERNQVTILCQSVTDQSLLFIELCQAVVNIDSGSVDFLHLFE